MQFNVHSNASGISRRDMLAAALLAPAGGAFAQAAAPNPQRVLTTNLRAPAGLYRPPEGYNGFKHRTLHIIGASSAELQVGFCGWHIPRNLEQDAPAYVYEKVAVELGARSVPVTFGGGRSVQVLGGVPFVLSDPVRARSFGVAAFTRDTQLLIRAIGRIEAPGAALPVGVIAKGAGMQMMSFAPAGRIDDVDSTGPLAKPTAAHLHALAPGPSLILGRPPLSALSVVCTGDSIADGAGDNATIATGRGFFNRAALDASGLRAIASLNLTKFGSTVGVRTAGLGVPGAPGYAYRQAMLKFANVLVDQYGTNTLGATGASAAANVLDTSRALWSFARGQGVRRIVRTSLQPRTISSNGYADAQGQAAPVNWGPGEAAEQVNAEFRSALAGREIDGVADLRAAVADPAAAYLWRSNGQRFFHTRDGVHPSTVASIAMARSLRAVYEGLRLP